jgi:REP element-mobilizing transposase RayT
VFALGRKSRSQYYGAIYHIIHRGKYDVLPNDEDKLAFLEILGDIKGIYDFKVISYCLLDNQYDLLIKTYNIPISKIMQRLNMRYVKYHNMKYMKTGSPFKGRYEGIIVNEGNYLIITAKYIHNLPVYLEKIDSMTGYKWSSDVFYRVNMDSVVDIYYILDYISPERNLAIEKYKEFMSSSEDMYDLSKVYYEKNNIFKKDIKPEIELDDILRSICINKVDFDLIKKGSRKSYLMKFKSDYIKASKELGFTCLEIGENIGISDRAVRKYLLSR